MSGLKLSVTLIAVAITAALLLAGCTSPTPTPATATPTVPPAISPAPTPTPAGSDRANITFSYVIHSSGKYFSNLQPAPEGYVYYALDVTVRSDKPIETDGTWFSVEYARNSSEAVKTYPATTVIEYPKTTIGYNSTPATGRVLVMLPEPEFQPYGPVPVYFKPLDEQKGPNKVYAPVYGTLLR